MSGLTLPPAPRPGVRFGGPPIRVALVNNMPESAFLETERQFAALLEASPLPTELDRYLVEGLPRKAGFRQREAAGYRGLAQLFRLGADAVIVSGAEPRGARLDVDPLWGPLTELFTWAAARRVALLCSCLAAHAAAAFFDGLERVRLPAKRFGVFEQTVDPDHPLAAGLPARVGFPHSRWNDLPGSSLLAGGYRLLLGDQTDWTVATAERGGSFLTLVQGHPEYRPDTLLRELRRDLRRHLEGEQTRPPDLPTSYLPPVAEAALESAVLGLCAGPRTPGAIEDFPLAELAARVEHRWEAPARRLYANWLTELAHRRAAPAAAS